MFSLNLLGEDAKGAGAARGFAPRVDRTMAGGVGAPLLGRQFFSRRSLARRPPSARDNTARLR